VDHLPITTAAVCVYPARVADAVAALEGTNINVAAVATGFPSGQVPDAHARSVGRVPVSQACAARSLAAGLHPARLRRRRSWMRSVAQVGPPHPAPSILPIYPWIVAAV